jgi:hypothetical protein
VTAPLALVPSQVFSFFSVSECLTRQDKPGRYDVRGRGSMDAVWELHVIALAVLHAEMYVKLIEYDEMTVDELERRGLVQSLDAVAAILVGNVTSKYDGLVGFDEIVVTDVADTQPTQCTLERLMAAGIVVALTANRQAVARK